MNCGSNAHDIIHGMSSYSHDSNTTITILYNKLKTISPKPPNLILHMDNCWRENKNQYIFAFCSYLIEVNVFVSIEMHFLPQGHTHDKNDSCFISIAKGLKLYNIVTPLDFASSFVPSSYVRYKIK